ncbi:hypothetical protein GCM10010885_08690 [Alicyclobacillus cellulosilyticus]|uniref:Uncharacterized protein n=1 Tax=Alicyclobacillus cellulosilyticus TaxID=1003997 RepID=A0A917K5N4_9BACL|nr:hypothetical protein [Alicyclobacillus cellulosilyticus]GGJ01735.1 hypothetical protein GCM10010885_08690 [Alicyclobacillus cellulosilyticus]
MIIGFGFGDPLTSLLMLLATSLASYGIYRLVTRRRRPRDKEARREQLRRYYYEQRELARRMAREFDLTDEEIERRIDEELRDDGPR